MRLAGLGVEPATSYSEAGRHSHCATAAGKEEATSVKLCQQSAMMSDCRPLPHRVPCFEGGRRTATNWRRQNFTLREMRQRAVQRGGTQALAAPFRLIHFGRRVVSPEIRAV